MSFEDALKEWHSLKGDEVMGYCYGAMGDSFAMFSHSVLCGIKFGHPMLLSVNGGGKKEANFRKFLEIVEHPHAIELTTKPACKFEKLFCTRKHTSQYCSMKNKWLGNTSGPICYHYDKITAHKRAERFPDIDEENYFLNTMNEIEAINISYPMPLDEVAFISSRCSRFVGIESGISHIMHAIGIPVTIRNWNGKWSNNRNKVEMYHPNKQYDLIKTFYELKK